MLFSTVVALLSLVVCRVRNSVHASYQLLEQDISVGVKAVYNRLNSLPIALIEALVRESALRIFAIVDALQAPLRPIIPGFKTRIVDGNHLAATEHRVQPLRTLGGGALPGLALVVYDAERGLVQRAYLSEDGHEQERSITVCVMMTQYGIQPSRYLEIKYHILGKIISLRCYVIGWFMPYYFAGRLESGNVCEYFVMMRYFNELGITAHDEELDTMALNEKSHEVYFQKSLETNRLLPLFEAIFGWKKKSSFNDVDLQSKSTVEESKGYCKHRQ